MTALSNPPLRLAELIVSLSFATDLGMGQPPEWALQSCLLAVHIGDGLQLSEDELVTVYYLALLHFVGCTADSHELSDLFGDELAMLSDSATLDMDDPAQLIRFMLRHAGSHQAFVQRAQSFSRTLLTGQATFRQISRARCEVAVNIAERMEFSADVQQGLWQVFERWDGYGVPHQLRGEAISRYARIVRLAQDAATFYRNGGAEAATAIIRKRSGRVYDPQLAEYFCAHAARLLALLKEPSGWDAVLAIEPGIRPLLSEQQFDAAAYAIADFADIKSLYTINHSRGVANLATAAAQHLGLPDSDVQLIQYASLLHDIGRVGISNSIWDKPGSLTESEQERVRLHPYYTERILSRAPALARLGAVAALHHERLDGSGYHRNSTAATIPTTARILATADAYHAMTELRPHRAALSSEVAADMILQDLQAYRFDPQVAAAVLHVAGHQLSRKQRKTLPKGLSPREVEILRLVAQGLTNRQIAHALSISPKTVDHHIQHIYNKIDVSTRAAATMFAMQHNLIK